MSFSIPFGLDSDVDVVMGNPVITRSVSSDQLNPAAHPAPYTPPEDLSHLMSKSSGANGPQRASWASQAPSVHRMAEENSHAVGETGELPTIEEALQIIHNESKMEPRLHPDGAPDGFYLHSPDEPSGSRTNLPVSCSAPSRSGMTYRPVAEPSRTRNGSDCSRDDDSVLRDGSVDSDASEDLPKAQSTPNTPGSGALSARVHAKEASDSGVRMTSFAERKKKQSLDSPKADASAAAAPMTSWVQKSEESPGKSSQQVGSEASELEVRLHEKRRAIEAQKKRIEAIFAKHRQRLGKSAFMQLKKEEREDEVGEEVAVNGQVSASSTEEELSRLTLEDRLARMEVRVGIARILLIRLESEDYDSVNHDQSKIAFISHIICFCFFFA